MESQIHLASFIWGVLGRQPSVQGMPCPATETRCHAVSSNCSSLLKTASPWNSGYFGKPRGTNTATCQGHWTSKWLLSDLIPSLLNPKVLLCHYPLLLPKWDQECRSHRLASSGVNLNLGCQIILQAVGAGERAARKAESWLWGSGSEAQNAYVTLRKSINFTYLSFSFLTYNGDIDWADQNILAGFSSK